jgi:hypothetical protein
MMSRLILAAALPLLGACATGVPASPPSGSSSAEPPVCRSTMLQQFAGRPATAELGAEIIRASGAQTVQWIPAGTMVTMEFREGRVRIWLDEQNRVQRASCG